MKTQIKKIILLLTIPLTILTLLNATTQTFSNYQTTFQINSNSTIQINQSLTLKNTDTTGINPDQIEFRINKNTENGFENVKILEVQAKDNQDKTLKSQIFENEQHQIIILDIKKNLKPNQEYNFQITYKFSYESEGILFKSLKIPITQSSIPIEKGTFTIQLPNKYHFTYTQNNNQTPQILGKTATWQIQNNNPNSIGIEYSYIPIKIANFKGSYIFWIIINIIILIFLAFEIKREIEIIRQEENE